MRTLRMLTMGVLTVGTAVALYRRMAEEKGQAPARFIEDIAQKGMAELEAAKLALEKSTSTEVKAFAYEMIDDHTALNRDIRQLARNKGYEMPQEVDMVSRAKELLLSLREAEGFDAAYAAFQIEAHEKAIAVCKKAAQLDDFDVSSFASKAAHKLEHHLKMAQDLKKQLRDGPLKPGNGSNGSKSADAARSGSSTLNTPAAGEVVAESNVASELAKEDDSALAKGTPQQGRGKAKNPGH